MQDFLRILSITLHVLAAAALFGAVLHLRYFVLPSRDDQGEEEDPVVSASGAKGFWLIYSSIAALIVTGVYQYATFRIVKKAHPMLGTKILIAIVAWFLIAKLFGKRGKNKSNQSRKKLASLCALLLLVAFALGEIAAKYF